MCVQNVGGAPQQRPEVVGVLQDTSFGPREFAFEATRIADRNVRVLPSVPDPDLRGDGPVVDSPLRRRVTELGDCTAPVAGERFTDIKETLRAYTARLPRAYQWTIAALLGGLLAAQVVDNNRATFPLTSWKVYRSA